MVEFWAGFMLGFASGAAWRDLSHGDKRQATGPRLMRRWAVTPASAPAAVQPGTVAHLEWDLKLQAFAFWGDQCHFSSRTMCYRWRVVTEPGWDIYMGLLRGLGAVQVRQSASTRWTDGWGVRTLRCVLKHGLIAVPYPNMPIPPVSSTLPAPRSPRRSAVRS